MKRSRIGLWILPGVLAALFLLAGTSKFLMTVEDMNKDAPVKLPGAFLHFIGACEILGALGLILPVALNVLPALTPIAAAGLLVIMLGATAVTLIGGMGAVVAIPFTIGLLLGLVLYGRHELLFKVRHH